MSLLDVWKLGEGNKMWMMVGMGLTFLVGGHMVILAAGGWVFWILMSVIVGIFQMVYVTYQLVMISMDIVLLAVLKSVATLNRLLFQRPSSRKRIWRNALRQCLTYQDYLQIHIQEPTNNNHNNSNSNGNNSLLHRSMSMSVFRSASAEEELLLSEHQREENDRCLSHSLSSNDVRRKKKSKSALVTATVMEELGEAEAEALVSMTERLREARTEHPEEMDGLEFLVASVMKRTHDNLLIQNARSVVNKGTHEFSHASRLILQNYNQEIENCLQHIGNVSIPQPINITNTNSDSNINSNAVATRAFLKERIKVMKKMQHNMGRTALMLSGGGAQSMYHIGTIKGLCESNLYDDITVISGTSGGSITAGMCALKTKEELLRDVCVPTVSTDYMLTGEMKKNNIRWFPPLHQMGQYWLQNRLLVDPVEFQKCCHFYYGDVTFEEAFAKTGKHVCITVTASRGSSATRGQRLLLNHISTPHVTIASAVAASCALPGVMAPAKLKTKKNQQLDVDGTEWIDGSVQADLPFRRISTLFNVSNYIVCQTNFHVLPFLNKEYHPSVTSTYWRIFQTCEWDIRSRALHLSRLGLFPKIFGQDVSKVFQQKYHGNLTLVPRFTTMQVFGLKSLVNPTLQDMKVYLKNGQETVWPYLTVIREMLRLETAIEKSLTRLEERLRNTYTSSIITESYSSSFSENDKMNTNTNTNNNTIEESTLESLLQKIREYEEEITSLKQQLREQQQQQTTNKKNNHSNNHEKDDMNLTNNMNE